MEATGARREARRLAPVAGPRRIQESAGCGTVLRLGSRTRCRSGSISPRRRRWIAGGFRAPLSPGQFGGRQHASACRRAPIRDLDRGGCHAFDDAAPGAELPPIIDQSRTARW